jgi:hypothetical protein
VDRTSARGGIDRAMTRRPSLPIIALPLLLAATVDAQTLNGTAEWTVVRGDAVSGDQDAVNNSIWQRYTVGYSAPLLDPRLLKYDTEFSFRTNNLAYGGDQNARDGYQNTIGYRLGATAFPARPFPFFIQASRDTVGESGDYPTTSGIRGGIVVPPDAPLPDSRTKNRLFNAGWQLTVPSLPRVELNYHSGSTNIVAGPYAAGQEDEALQVGVFKDSKRTRQAIRFNRSSFANVATTAFDQRLSDLDYEFGMMLGRRSRLLTHAGRRNTFSLFDLPPQVVDPGTQPYRPPSRGEVNNLYATTALSYDPSNRLSISLTGNADRQDAEPVATSARLATTTARYEVGRGLSLTAGGTYGERGQVFENSPITVMTRSGQVGSTYRAGAPWLEGTIAVMRGAGSNTTPDGQTGSLGAWSGQATLASSIRAFSVSGGFERQHSEDDILDYGNFDGERLLGSVQAHGRVVSVIGSWEHANVARGRGALLATNRLETFSVTLSYQVGRESRLAANAGGFTNRADTGLDRTRYWGGIYESQPFPRFHVSAAARYEDIAASQVFLRQNGVRGFGQVEYRLRLFSFAVEYRDDEQRLESANAPKPFTFAGRQLQLRITRRFGVKL